MDRSKWEYRKLCEICDKGSSNIAQNKIEDITGEYSLYGASGYVKGIDFYHQEKPYIGIVKDGSGVGRASLYPAKSSLLGTMQYIIPKDGCELGFLLYVIKGLHLEKYKTGAAIPHIYFKNYGKSIVPFPPLADQQQIVAELDCLNEMIAVKQEQLKEFDKLAHSIFYDMFGAPVINDKGWEIARLDEYVSLINGRAYNQDELLPYGKYKVVRVGNFFSNSSYYYSNLELDDDKYCSAGDLLYTWSASFGARIWEGEKVIYHYHIWKVNFDSEKYDKLFLCYLLNILTNKFKENVHGVTMVHLTKAGMEKARIPIPPLSLQQHFAEKLSVIQAQIVLVKQSIAETQALLDYTMDKYFG